MDQANHETVTDQTMMLPNHQHRRGSVFGILRRRSSVFTVGNLSLLDGIEDDNELLNADTIDSFFTGKEIAVDYNNNNNNNNNNQQHKQQQQQQQDQSRREEDLLNNAMFRQEEFILQRTQSINQLVQGNYNNKQYDNYNDMMLGGTNLITPDHSRRSITFHTSNNNNNVHHHNDRNNNSKGQYDNDYEQQQSMIQTQIDEWNTYYNKTQIELQIQYQRTLKKLKNSMRRTEESRNLIKRQRINYFNNDNNNNSRQYSNNNSNDYQHYNNKNRNNANNKNYDDELEYSRRCIQELIRKETTNNNASYNNNNNRNSNNYNNDNTAMWYR